MTEQERSTIEAILQGVETKDGLKLAKQKFNAIKKQLKKNKVQVEIAELTFEEYINTLKEAIKNNE